MRHYVDFRGDPARAVFFSVYQEEDVELREIEDLRPEPPFL